MKGFWIVAALGFVSLNVIDWLPVEIRGITGLVMGSGLACFALHSGKGSRS